MGYRQLPREAFSIWQIQNVAGTGVAVVVALAFFHGPVAPAEPGPWEWLVLGAIAVAGLLEGCLIIPRRYASYRYVVLDHAFVVERGRLITRRLVFPTSQILYVETHQGPVLRQFGLFTVRIGTIAEPHSIGPLPKSVADELESHVEGRTGAG